MSSFLDDIYAPVEVNLDQRPKEEKPNHLSVSQISNMIQGTLTSSFSNITVKGEVSGAKFGPTGHLYFDLKDDSSVIRAICWKGVASKLPMKIEDGLEVIAKGGISTYSRSSTYQLICKWVEASGAGALMALLEERKKKLQAEGLFDPARKRPLPFMPKSIGVITSPTGAVIRDILHRLEDRFGVQVYLYPVQVQGEGAAEQIVEGLNYFNGLREDSKLIKPDVLILARGGGSVEDLWCFNEEGVVRGVAGSDIPIITAVGHETDTTLVDYASDKRAPTPTAAAEMAVPVKNELNSYLMDLKSRNYNSIYRTIDNLNKMLELRARSLISPKQMIMGMIQRKDAAEERLRSSLLYILKEKESKLQRGKDKLQPYLLTRLLDNKAKEVSSYKSLLNSYDYKNVLKRGYSITRLGDKIVRNSSDLSAGDGISLEFSDGKKQAVIDGRDNQSPAPQKVKKKSDNKNLLGKPKVKNEVKKSQQSLFD